MNKLFLLGALCLLSAGMAQAETVSGEVVDVRKNAITVQTEDGEKEDHGPQKRQDLLCARPCV